MNKWAVLLAVQPPTPGAVCLSPGYTLPRPGTCAPQSGVSVGTRSIGAPSLAHSKQQSWTFWLVVALPCAPVSLFWLVFGMPCAKMLVSWDTAAAGDGVGHVEVPWAGTLARRADGPVVLAVACHGQRPRELVLQSHDDQRGGARQRVWHQGLGDAV